MIAIALKIRYNKNRFGRKEATHEKTEISNIIKYFVSIWAK